MLGSFTRAGMVPVYQNKGWFTAGCDSHSWSRGNNDPSGSLLYFCDRLYQKNNVSLGNSIFHKEICCLFCIISFQPCHDNDGLIELNEVVQIWGHLVCRPVESRRGQPNGSPDMRSVVLRFVWTHIQNAKLLGNGRYRQVNLALGFRIRPQHLKLEPGIRCILSRILLWRFLVVSSWTSFRDVGALEGSPSPLDASECSFRERRYAVYLGLRYCWPIDICLQRLDSSWNS